MIKNKAYINNIRKSPRALTALTNGGKQVSEEVGDTIFFRQVWYNPASMANILSLADVCKYARVTMDSQVKRSMFVHREDGYVMEFREFRSGLYYFDVAEHGGSGGGGYSNTVTSKNSSNNSYNYFPYLSLVQTVAANEDRYTRREVRDAERARSLRMKLGPPSERDF